MPDTKENKGWYWMAKQEWEKCIVIGAPAVEPLIAAFKDEHKWVRQAAARALVAMYQKATLSGEVRQEILAYRSEITSKYRDEEIGIAHFDQGIGVDFPL